MSIARTLALIESAPVGSAELDAAIAAALEIDEAPYSRSLDAALQLVPDGWSVAGLAQRTDARGRLAGWTAELYRPSVAVLSDAPARVMPSAALALTFACLHVSVERQRSVRAA
jgi:hypothetical protein